MDAKKLDAECREHIFDRNLSPDLKNIGLIEQLAKVVAKEKTKNDFRKNEESSRRERNWFAEKSSGGQYVICKIENYSDSCEDIKDLEQETSTFSHEKTKSRSCSENRIQYIVN